VAQNGILTLPHAFWPEDSGPFWPAVAPVVGGGIDVQVLSWRRFKKTKGGPCAVSHPMEGGTG